MAALESLLEKLASEYTHRYGPSPLPCQIDAEVASLVDAIADSDGTETLPAMRETHGFVFLAYARRMASLAVRENSIDILSKGMTALVIGSRLVYFKESVPILALMYNSAIKIGADPSKLFSGWALNDDDVFKVNMDNFLTRSAEDRSIQAMGFVEGEDEGGFRYFST